MKKVYLSVIGFTLLCRLSAYSQAKEDTSRNKTPFSLYAPVGYDTSDYRPKNLHIDEVNLFSSYYKQNGDHSAITGGIGTEKVTDISNGLEVKWVGWDDMNCKHTLTEGLGIDHHSSASSAYVNKSGASKVGGTRIYHSLNWNVEN